MISGPTTAAWVLDTNVALDWLAFADPRTRVLEQAWDGGGWTWLATASMRDELVDVLGRPAFRRFDAAALMTLWDARVDLRPEPPRCDLPCRDPDDQVFLDLALHAGAQRLLSRDRALLELARAAARRGLHVCTPADWSGPAGTV